jgi:hypothetical protein
MPQVGRLSNRPRIPGPQAILTPFAVRSNRRDQGSSQVLVSEGTGGGSIAASFLPIPVRFFPRAQRYRDGESELDRSVSRDRGPSGSRLIPHRAQEPLLHGFLRKDE